MKKFIGPIIVIIGIIVDQLTKILALNITTSIEIIPNFLSFSLVKNYGAAFGIAQGASGILAVISAIICIAVLIIIYYTEKKDEKAFIGLFLILSGGIGNLIDRAFRGYVVDFIDTPFIATFNIADSLIVIGCIWVILEEVFSSIFSKRKGT